MIKTKKISQVGYLPKTEKISDTWHELELDVFAENKRLALLKRDAEDGGLDNWFSSLKVPVKKVKVTLTLIVEELK